jgi:general secretion pathway protein K
MKRIGLFGLSDRGIALPLVLWTITVLMAVVLSLAFSVRTEMRMTMNFRGSIEKKMLAEAGVERALMEISYRNAIGGKGSAQPDLQVWRIDGVPYSAEMGTGGYKVGITEESGKIAINALTDATGVLLKNLLEKLEVPSETADTIVDSVLDWKDGDDLHRLKGAESDYYQSLPIPYKAKNANFETPEELLLVKGMTEEILFGDGKKKGILPFITIFSHHTGVSLAAAPKEVLLSIPGMTEGVVENILAYRDSTPVWDEGEAAAVLGSVAAAIRPYLSAESQQTYTVASQGYKNGEKGVYGITATVTLVQNGYAYRYYKSPVWMEQ